MIRWRTVSIAMLAATVAGCVKVEYVPTSSLQPRSPKMFSEVLMTYEKPAKPNVTTGRIEAKEDSFDKSLKSMRQFAAKLGLDGVSEIYCSRDGDVRAGACAGNGFIWGAK